jgi:hypothetical protein
MLPAFLAEGWLMAVIARMVFFENSKDSVPLWSGKPAMAGMVAFALIKYLQTGIIDLLDNAHTIEPETSDVTGGMFLLAAAIFALSLWVFKFLWVYVPLSANLSLKNISRLLRGPFLSFYMMGIWLLCIVPAFIFMAAITSSVIEPYRNAAEIPVIAQTILLVFQAGLDIVAGILATAAMAYAFRSMIESRKQA